MKDAKVSYSEKCPFMCSLKYWIQKSEIRSVSQDSQYLCLHTLYQAYLRNVAEISLLLFVFKFWEKKSIIILEIPCQLLPDVLRMTVYTCPKRATTHVSNPHNIYFSIIISLNLFVRRECLFLFISVEGGTSMLIKSKYGRKSSKDFLASPFHISLKEDWFS